MRFRDLRAASFIAAVLIVAGCDAGSPLADTADLDAASKNGQNSVVASVTGSGHAWIESGDPGNPFWRTFTLTAWTRADGTAQGRFGYNSHPGLTRVAGRVVCLSTNGTEAAVKVVIDQFDDPNHERPEALWFVIRDGQPDSFSPGIPEQYVSAAGCEFYSVAQGVPFEDADAGDFTVRSGQ
jgi:hypothetical protein